MTDNPPQNDEAELLESSKGQDDSKNEESKANSPAESQSGEQEDSNLTTPKAHAAIDTPEESTNSEDPESTPPEEAPSEPDQSDKPETSPNDEDAAEEAETSEPEKTPEAAPTLSMDSDVDLVDNIEDTRVNNIEAFRHCHKTVLLDRPDQALDGPMEEPVPEPVFESEVKATEVVENSPAEIEGRETVVYHDLVEGELSFETQAPTLDEVMIPQSVEEADELVDESHWTETAGLESDPDNFPYVSNMPKTVRMNPNDAGRVLDDSSSDVPFTDIAALDPEFDKTTTEDLESDSVDPIFDRSRSESGEFEVAKLSPLEALEAVDEILDGGAPEPHSTQAPASEASEGEPNDSPVDENSSEDAGEASEEQPDFPAPNGPDPELDLATPSEDDTDGETAQNEADETITEQAAEQEDVVFPATTIPEALPYDDSDDQETDDEKEEKQTSETQLFNKVLIAPAAIEEGEGATAPPKKLEEDPSRRATKAMTNPLGMDEITASLQEISANQKTTRFSDPLTATTPTNEKPFSALNAPLEEGVEEPTEDGETPVSNSSPNVARSPSGRLERPDTSTNKITTSKKPSSLFPQMKNRRDSQKLSPRRRPTSSLVRPDLPKKSLNTPLRQYSSNINAAAAEQAPGRIRQDALEEIFKRWQDIKKEDVDP